MRVEPRFDDLVVDGNRPVSFGRNHAVQQEQTLEEEVEGNPKEEDIAEDLNEWEGAVEKCLEEWREITSDPIVLSKVSGCTTDFQEAPQPQFEPKPLIFNAKEIEMISV